MNAREDIHSAATSGTLTEAALLFLLDKYRAEVLREAAELVRADVDHICYGSATNYAERHAALLISAASGAGSTGEVHGDAEVTS